MKIDKRNPLHWAYLILSTINTIVGIIYRKIMGSSKEIRIVMYGHKLNGNLKALYEYIIINHPEIEIHFLTMDPYYYSSQKDEHNILLSLNPIHMLQSARANVWITDHGLHSFILFQKYTDIKFIDVWHGIPYKGFDREDFKSLHTYDQVWVSSPSMKKMYIDKFGFPEKAIKIIGYTRTDPLINQSYNKNKLIQKYKLGGFSKIILIAPTWKQDSAGRSIIPFNININKFFGELNKIAKKHDALIVFRAHLNSTETKEYNSLPNLKVMSYAKYPQAEEFLFISDILVSDWSSISFDYLVLRRPTIFLDVDAPFAKGFSYGPEYRFGKVIKSFEMLKTSLEEYLEKEPAFQKEFKDKMEEVSNEVYNKFADGKSCERACKQIDLLINKN